jgi:hypothetical protein
MTNNISTHILSQLRTQLQRLAPDQYQACLPVLSGSSIGAHTRHIIEFYQCLLQGAASGIVNYDARERNMLLQENLTYTLFLIQDICEQLAIQRHLSPALHLVVEYEGGHAQHIGTNFLREETYLIEHSVHHFALIRIGIQESFPGVPIDAGFGVAYSTLAFQQKQAQTTAQSICAS